jgi:hypothetical protein
MILASMSIVLIFPAALDDATIAYVGTFLAVSAAIASWQTNWKEFDLHADKVGST